MKGKKEKLGQMDRMVFLNDLKNREAMEMFN